MPDPTLPDTPARTAPAADAPPTADGLAAARARMREVTATVLEGLCALPLRTLAVFAVVLSVVQATATGAEFVFLRSSLALIMPEQSAGLRSVISVGILLGYAVLWFVVGSRLAAAREAQIAGDTTTARAGVRAFGAVGALYAGLALLALVGLTWRRASVLADRAEAKARAAADTATGLLGDSSSAAADSVSAAGAAHRSVFWSDALFVGGVMLMLAAVSIVVGFAVHLLAKAWRVVAAEAAADRAERRAHTADTARHRAHHDLLSRTRMREDREVLADRHLEALGRRFDHARAHARMYLAVRLGDPSSTSHIITAPPGTPAVDPSKPDRDDSTPVVPDPLPW